VIPVPFVLGLLGLVLLLFLASQAAADPGDDPGPLGWPDGSRPPAGSVRAKVFFEMHIVARTRYGGTTWLWNADRTARKLGIAVADVEDAYPESYWDSITAQKRAERLDAFASVYQVRPEPIVAALAQLQAEGLEFNATTPWSQVAGEVALMLAEQGWPGVPAFPPALADGWRTYVRLVGEG